MRKTNNVSRLMVLASALYCASLPTFATSTVPESMASVVQQTTKLKGVVLDAKTGEPIIGANVLIKGRLSVQSLILMEIMSLKVR